MIFLQYFFRLTVLKQHLQEPIYFLCYKKYKTWIILDNTSVSTISKRLITQMLISWGYLKLLSILEISWRLCLSDQNSPCCSCWNICCTDVQQPTDHQPTLLLTVANSTTIWNTPRMCAACHLSPHSAAAERSCSDSWSSGKSSSPPLRESCWNWDPGGKSWVRVWTRQKRWSGGGLVTRDRPSWGVAQAGTRRHSCLWQTTSSSFNSNG